MSSRMRVTWSTTKVALAPTYPVSVERIAAIVPAAMWPVGVSNDSVAGIRSLLSSMWSILSESGG